MIEDYFVLTVPGEYFKDEKSREVKVKAFYRVNEANPQNSVIDSLGLDENIQEKLKDTQKFISHLSETKELNFTSFSLQTACIIYFNDLQPALKKRATKFK